MCILVVFDLKILNYCLLNFFKIKTNIFFLLTFENLKWFKTLANVVVVDEFIAVRVGGLTPDQFCFGERRHVCGCCGIWHFSSKISRNETFSLCCVNGKILLTGDRMLREVLFADFLEIATVVWRRGEQTFSERCPAVQQRYGVCLSNHSRFRNAPRTRGQAVCPARPNVSCLRWHKR